MNMKNAKRICYVISGDLWGGAEAQVFQLVKCMVERGYQIFVITLNKGMLFDKLSKLPVEVISFDESKMSPVTTIFKIWSFLRTNKIDLAHSHGFKENLLVGAACKIHMECKVVRTHHGRGVVNGSLVKKYIEKINAHILTDRIIAVSHDLKSFLAELGYPLHKIDVVHNGVDCRGLSALKNSDEIISEHSIPDGSLIIGTASRIEREKGLEYLLLAVKELRETGLPVVLLIVGSGNLQQKYQQMANEMGIIESVIFAGFKKDVCSYLKVFDLFVMMSLNEGIPLALIEAMYMHNAVICSEVGGIPEVVISGENGILVPSMDYLSCAKACEEVLRNKALRVRLGENAHNHVINNFSAQKSADNTIKIYEGIMAS